MNLVAEGPRSTREIFAWPQELAYKLSRNAEGMCRLRSVLLDGVVVYSDCSGYGAEREALLCTLRAVAAEQKWDIQQHCPIQFARVCDIGDTPQSVLLHVALDYFEGTMCVFQDVIDHAVEAISTWLRATQPPKEASPESAREQYAVILEWLVANRSWAFPSDARASCRVPKAKRQRTTAKSTHSSRRPLALNVAGVTCDGWSTMGTRAHFSHASELPHSAWLVERLARCEQGIEDLIFVECTSQCPAKEKLKALEKTHCWSRKATRQILDTQFADPGFACLLNKAGPSNWEEEYEKNSIAVWWRVAVSSLLHLTQRGQTMWRWRTNKDVHLEGEGRLDDR